MAVITMTGLAGGGARSLGPLVAERLERPQPTEGQGVMLISQGAGQSIEAS